MEQLTHKNSVLVVEDNPINLQLAVSMLERLGIEVNSAMNGQEAIDLLSDGLKPDLILMDLQMPVMDGIEATTKIIQMQEHAPIIVAMTANVEQSYQNECADAGMADFIEKPIRLARLKEVLPKHLPTLRVSAQNANWIDESHADDAYQHIDIDAIEVDFSECWDIFYKFYLEFVLYYQNQLPTLERLLKHQNSLEAKSELKLFKGLTAYFHPTKIDQLFEQTSAGIDHSEWTLALKSLRLARNEAQEIIREVSKLLSNETQKFKQ